MIDRQRTKIMEKDEVSVIAVVVRQNEKINSKTIEGIGWIFNFYKTWS